MKKSVKCQIKLNVLRTYHTIDGSNCDLIYNEKQIIEKRQYLKEKYINKLQTLKNTRFRKHILDTDPFKIYPNEDLLRKGLDIPEHWNVHYENNDKYSRSSYPDDKYQTLIDWSQMDHGKTFQLKEWLIRMKHKKKIQRIFFISFRRKLTANFQGRFRDINDKDRDIIIESYLDKTYSPIIIYQVESLARLHNVVGNQAIIPDLLVLDEATSVLTQFDSPFHKHKLDQNRKIFKFFFQNVKYVWLADADIDRRVINLVKQYRPNKSTYLNYNSHVIGNRKAYKCSSSHQIIAKIHDSLKNNKKIVIVHPSENSCMKFELLTQKLISKNNKNVRIYTAKQSDNYHELKDPNTHWKKFDCLIYNSTIGAGVSFDEKHFHEMFVFNSNRPTICVRELKQLIGRIRFLKDNNIYYYCPSSFKFNDFVEFDRNHILNDLKYKSNLKYSWLSSFFEHFNYDYQLVGNTFQYNLVTDFWTDLKIDNIIERKLSESFFHFYFDFLMISQGYIISSLPSNSQFKIHNHNHNHNHNHSQDIDSLRSHDYTLILNKYSSSNGHSHSIHIPPQILSNSLKLKHTGHASDFDKKIIFTSNVLKIIPHPTGKDIRTLEKGKNFNHLLHTLFDLNPHSIQVLLQHDKSNKYSLLSLKFSYISLLNKLLGLKYSGDYTKVFNNISFQKKLLPFVRNDETFNISCTLWDYKGLKPYDWQSLKKFINHIYRSWCGVTIKNLEKPKQKKINGKNVRVCDFHFTHHKSMIPILGKIKIQDKQHYSDVSDIAQSLRVEYVPESKTKEQKHINNSIIQNIFKNAITVK